jgi:hypothetical protein
MRLFTRCLCAAAWVLALSAGAVDATAKTVSGQDGINATKTAEPEEKFVAEQQAGRFSRCSGLLRRSTAS